MKIFIPLVGQTIRLLQDWNAPVAMTYGKANFNLNLLCRLGVMEEVPNSWETLNGEKFFNCSHEVQEKPIAICTLPKGTELKITKMVNQTNRSKQFDPSMCEITFVNTSAVMITCQNLTVQDSKPQTKSLKKMSLGVLISQFNDVDCEIV